MKGRAGTEEKDRKCVKGAGGALIWAVQSELHIGKFRAETVEDLVVIGPI